MKKLLGSVLALAFVVVTSQANAELLKNFKFGGSVEMSAISARNVVNFNTRANNNQTPSDHIGVTQTRIMLNMDWDLLDDVHSKVTLRKNNRIYGGGQGTGGGSEQLNDVQNQVFMDQAYIKIDKVFGFVDSTFGRQFYGEAGDLIIAYGPKVNQYGMNVTAIDGARFDWNGEMLRATVLAFEPDANTTNLTPGTYAGKADIRGFILGNKGNENLDAKVYVYNQETHAAMNTAALVRNDNLYIPGLKVKAKFAGLSAGLEVAYNLGENRTATESRRYDGKALLVDLGYKADVPSIAAINPWAMFGYGSGSGNAAANRNHNEDFTAIATDFRPGAIYGRFDASLTAGQRLANNANIASNGLTNRTLWGVGIKVTPAAVSKLTAGVAFYDFNLTSLKDGQTLIANAKGNRHIGSEIDATAEWKHSENVSFLGTVGNFQPGGLIKNINGAAGNANNPAWMSALDLAVKF